MNRHPSPRPAMDLLHRIPVTQRQVWIARRLDGLEDAAIADLFGIPSSAIPPMLDAADRAITSLLESDPAFRGVDHQAFIATILQETEPPATDVERLLASPRVRRALDAAARPRPTWSWRAPAPWMPATALVAGLAAALLWAGHVGFPFTNHGHPPPPTTPTAPASGDDAVTLLAAAEPTSLTLPTGIQVRYHGNGQLSGAPQAPHIDWRSGVLELSIPPHEGLELVVDTEEAQVEVVGTHYSVTRDALGTRVSVARGQVQVRCHHGDEASHGDPVERRLQSEQGLTCLPGRDAGFLSRALALQQGGASPQRVQAAAEAGLKLAVPDSDYRGELVWLRMQALEAGGHRDEAWAAAQRCLDDIPTCLGPDELRAVDLRRTAARLAYNAEGCTSALPYLEELAPQGRDLDLFALARCLEDTDPQRACDLLTSLQRRHLSTELHTQVRALKRRLGGGCP